jgi:ABC-type Fe3+/spermidine/putrescine transport system ATPase subunit
VRPEDITLHEHAELNAIPCRIKLIHYRGSFYEIDIELGSLSVKVIENKNNFTRDNWREEQQAFVQFKKYKVFETSEGHGIVREQLRQLGYIE